MTTWAERQQMIRAAALLGSGIPELQEKVADLDARVPPAPATPEEAAARLVLDRAIAVAAAPEALAAVQALTVPPDGSPWRQPAGAHDAYPVGALVAFDGRVWENLTPANVWTPGVSGWREVSEGPAPWVQPTGAHDAYPKDALVTHNGQTWRSDLDGNVWEPGVYGWTAGIIRIT